MRIYFNYFGIGTNVLIKKMRTKIDKVILEMNFYQYIVIKSITCNFISKSKIFYFKHGLL